MHKCSFCYLILSFLSLSTMTCVTLVGNAADLGLFNDNDSLQPGPTLGLGGVTKSALNVLNTTSYALHQIKSEPPGSYQYDTRLQTVAQAQWLTPLTSNLGLGLTLAAGWARTELTDSANANAFASQKSGAASLQIHLHAKLDNGLELFLNPRLRYFTPFQSEVHSTLTTMQTQYKSSFLAVIAGGFLKRAGNFAAGPYVSLSANAKRKFTQAASDGTSFAAEENLFSPTELGGVARVDFGTWVWDLMISLIKSGDHPTKTTAGLVMFDDSLGFWNRAVLKKGAWDAVAILAFYSASFSDQAYMSLDNISLWRFEMGSLNHGWADVLTTLGVVYGSDRQSLAQLNADYRHLSCYLKLAWLPGGLL